jgi:hypothetical protein
MRSRGRDDGSDQGFFRLRGAQKHTATASPSLSGHLISFRRNHASGLRSSQGKHQGVFTDVVQGSSSHMAEHHDQCNTSATRIRTTTILGSLHIQALTL